MELHLVVNAAIVIDNVSAKPNDVYLTIKEAVDALGVNGGNVIVESGDYAIDGTGNKTTIEIPSNCTITGNGNVNITVTANVTLFKNTGFGTEARTRINISGMKIYVNMSSGGYQQNLIHFKGLINGTIQDFTISAATGAVAADKAAIKLEGFYREDNAVDYPCSGIVVTRNSIEKFSVGISLKGFDVDHQDCTENMVTGNLIKTCTNAVVLDQAPFNIISGNNITGSSTCAMKTLGSDMNSIVGNIVANGDADGVVIDQSYGCVISGNAFAHNTTRDLHLKSANSSYKSKFHSISGNTFNNEAATGDHIGISLDENALYNSLSGNSHRVVSASAFGVKESSQASGTEKNLITSSVCIGGTPVSLGSGTDSIDANNKK